MILRAFWIIVLASTICGMLVIFKSTFDRFANDSININVDTMYLRWENTFPAVSFCLVKGNLSIVKEFVSPFMKENNITIPRKYGVVKYFKLLQDYLFLSPNNLIDEFEFCDTLNSTCGLNVELLQKLVSVPTSRVGEILQWSDGRFL